MEASSMTEKKNPANQYNGVSMLASLRSHNRMDGQVFVECVDAIAARRLRDLLTDNEKKTVIGNPGVDTLSLKFFAVSPEYKSGSFRPGASEDHKGTLIGSDDGYASEIAVVTFDITLTGTYLASEEMLEFVSNGQWHTAVAEWNNIAPDAAEAELKKELLVRSARLELQTGLVPTAIIPLKKLPYPYNTAEEATCFSAAIANGKSGAGWTDDEQAGQRIHAGIRRGKSLTHRTILIASEDCGLEELRTMTEKLTVTNVYMLNYILHILGHSDTGDGWVDLNDVAKQAGLNRQLAKDREEDRRNVMNLIRFVEKAEIKGERSIPYTDTKTKKKIDTYIHSSVWRVTDTQRPTQLLLPGDAAWRETPVAVHIALSARSKALLQDTRLRQELQFAERIGQLPGKKASVAYARAMALVLMPHFRMRKTHLLTRRELLTPNPPEVSPPGEVLASEHPARLVEYWNGALKILRGKGLILPEGEADMHKNLREGLPKQGGYDTWLDTPVDIRPGKDLSSSIASIPNKHPEKKPPAKRVKPTSKSI